MTNLINDISVLTSIPVFTLQKLLSISEDCICHSLLEQLDAGENCDTIDIGIGKLKLKIEDDELTYKFIPSKHLENAIINSVNGEDKLIKDIDESISTKIRTAYKELF